MDRVENPFLAQSLAVFRSFKELVFLFTLLFGIAAVLPLGGLLLVLGSPGLGGGIIAVWLLLLSLIHVANRLGGRRVERLLVERAESIEWIYTREVLIKTGTSTLGRGGFQVQLVDGAGKRYTLPCKSFEQSVGIVAELRRVAPQAQVDAEGLLLDAGLGERREHRHAS